MCLWLSGVFKVLKYMCWLLMNKSSHQLFLGSSGRNQRSPPTRRCGRLWVAGRTLHWLRTTGKASPGSWRQTTPCWWSPPASSTSARETVTSRRSEVSLTPRVTECEHLLVRRTRRRWSREYCRVFIFHRCLCELRMKSWSRNTFIPKTFFKCLSKRATSN